jgi:excisionase family DNA binding protein
MDVHEFLTVTQAAEYLGVTRQAIHFLTKRGLGWRIGSVWLFTRAELDAYRATPHLRGGRPPGAKTSVGMTSPVVLA